MEYHIFKRSLVFSFNDERDNITINEGDERFEKIKKMLAGKAKNKLAAIEKIVSAPMDTITEALDGIANFSIDKNVITYNGEPVEPFFGNKILEFRKAKKPYEYLLKFYERVEKNPSANSRKQLFKFLTHNGFPFTEDGKFIAYKSVKHNFTDHHSGKVDCSVGTIVEMPRDSVEDNPSSACSTGLHIGTFSYAKGFQGGFLLSMLVDPKDVVSVPYDNSHQKCRCCRYEVLKTVTEAYPKDQLVIISDLEKALKLPSTKIDRPAHTKVISTTASAVIINKKAYKMDDIKQEDLDKAEKKTSVQPSKRMKFFKDMGKSISQMWKDAKAGIFYVKTDREKLIKYTPTDIDSIERLVVAPIKKKSTPKKSTTTKKKAAGKKTTKKKPVEKKGIVVIAKKEFKVTVIKEAAFKKVKGLKSIKPSARNAYFKSLTVIEMMWKSKTEFYVLTHDEKYIRYTPVKK